MITSPSWPASYPSYEDCYWVIEQESNKGIRLAFMDFDLNVDHDGCDDVKVKIKGEMNRETRQVDPVFWAACTVYLPPSFTTTLAY